MTVLVRQVLVFCELMFSFTVMVDCACGYILNRISGEICSAFFKYINV